MYALILKFMGDRPIFNKYNVHNMMNDSNIGFKPINLNSKDVIYFSIEFMTFDKNIKFGIKIMNDNEN
jgi:hypothetical protein